MNRLLATALFFGISSTLFAQTDDDVNDKALNGLWVSYTNSTALNSAVSAQPNLKGAFLRIKWSSLEPATPGTFDWTELDTEAGQIVAKSLKITLILYTGNNAPAWLHDQFAIDTFKNSENEVYPDYLNADYQARWRLMVTKTLEHVAAASYASSVSIVQAAEGSTGDEVGFHGSFFGRVPTYIGPADTDWPSWVQWRKDSWIHLNTKLKLYFPDNSKPSKSSVTLLVNPSNDDTQIADYTTWLNTLSYHINNEMKYTWLKAGSVGHGYQLNEESTQKVMYDPYINTITTTGNTQVRCRSEFDEGNSETAWFLDAPKWNMYWMAVNAVHFGLDYWCFTSNYYTTPEYGAGFSFFAKYAGYKDPATANLGFCALRDGLDAHSPRFSSLVSGAGSQDDFSDSSNKSLSPAYSSTWTSQILANYYGYGAKQGDYIGANGGAFHNRHADHMNDVGWDIFTGNLERHISEVNQVPANNLQRGGVWRVGPKTGTIPNDPYGRFAKSFSHGIGLDNFYFDINNSLNLRASTTAPSGRSVHLRVTYLNKGNSAKFQVVYKEKQPDGSLATKTVNVNLAGTTEKWEFADIYSPAMLISNNMTLSGGAPYDFRLTSVSPYGAVIFHMVEIEDWDGVSSRMRPEALVTDAASPAGLRLSPNPGNGLVSLQWDDKSGEPFSLEVLNGTGNRIELRTGLRGGTTTADLSRQPAGTYFIRMRSASRTQEARYVKQQ